MGKKSEFKSGAILNYINVFISLASGLLLTPFMVRAMGQHEYGLYNLIGAFAGYLSLIEFGMGATIIRYVAKYNSEGDLKKRENFLAIGLLIYTIIAIIMSLAATIMYLNIGKIFGNTLASTDIYKAKTMFALICLNMVLATIGSVFNAATAGCEYFKIPKLLTMCSTVLRIVLVIVILTIGPSALNVTYITVFVGILSTLCNVYYSINIVKIRVKLHYWDNKLFKEAMLFSFFNFLQLLMSQIYWKLDELIIGSMISASMVAIYAVAMNLNTFTLNITTAITGVILPKATHLAVKKASVRETTDFMVDIGRIILSLYSIILLGFTFFGKKFVILWAGEEYSIAYYIALIVIAFSAIPRIQGAANDIMKAKNLHGFTTMLYVVTGIINVGITIYLLKYIGIIGAAIGTAFSLFVGNTLIANIYYHKFVGIDVPYFFKNTFKGIGYAIVIMSIICLLLNLIPGSGWISLSIQCLIYAIIFISLLYFIGFNDKEKKFIKSILRRGNHE